MKRRHPHTLRPDGHRSTPSLLSQTSPNRRSSSPQGYPNPGNDWARRNFTGSSNTSPARSTFSLASTANIRASATATSVTTTPGRIPPPSPLYYDYTEEFEADEVSPPEAIPPPLFTIHKTIPEDRPMSSGSPDPHTLHNDGSCMSGLPPVQSPTFNKESLLHSEDIPNLGNDTAKIGSTASRSSSAPATTLASEISLGDQERKYFSLSGLGYGPRELSDHVEGAFKFEPLGTFDVAIAQGPARPRSENKRLGSSRTASRAEQSVSPSEQMFGTDFQRSSPQPMEQNILAKDFVTGLQPRKSTDLLLQQSCASSFHTSHSRRNSQESVVRKELPASAHTNTHSRRTSQESVLRKELPAPSVLASSYRRPLSSNLSNRPGLTGLDGSDMPSNPNAALQGTPEWTTERSESVLTKSKLHSSTPVSQTPASETMSGTISVGKKDTQVHVASYSHSPDYSSDYHYQPPSTLPDYKSIRIPNFSHRIKASSGLHGNPMLAPKPISPARQLKLKNSIPQLMKALPALPAEPVLSLDSQSGHRTLPTGEFPKRSTPVTTSNTANTVHSKDESLTMKSPVVSASSVGGQTRSDLSNFGSENYVSTIEEEAPPSPSKLKLKLKSSNASRFQPQTPLQTHATNSEDSYPWVNQDSNTSSEPHQDNNNRQRFRLRLARSSMKDQGTVRVTRSSTDERPTTGFGLGSPKDLFSPGPGLENMFRQVSRHIHSRKTSTNSTVQPDAKHTSGPSSAHQQSSTDTEHLLSSAAAYLEPPPNTLNLGEAGSCFSDDSSQEELSGSLRRRLTHLKSKIAVPYGSRSGTQSYDDITWRDRNVAENAVPPAARSIPDFHENIDRATPEVKPARRFSEGVHRSRLKAKMQGWLKGARAVFGARVKPKHSVNAA